MIQRRAVKRLKQSGLSEAIQRETFDTFKADESWQRNALMKAIDYSRQENPGWFYIFGKPGTGKSHLCTAICGERLKRNEDIRYMLWRDESRDLKALINDSEAYNELMKPLKRCGVLYIDDFFKGGTTEADIRLAFELINSRYVSRRPTIISSELSLEDILDLDEALGSRIYEMAKGYVIHAKGENWRLRS